MTGGDGSAGGQAYGDIPPEVIEEIAKGIKDSLVSAGLVILNRLVTAVEQLADSYDFKVRAFVESQQATNKQLSDLTAILKRHYSGGQPVKPGQPFDVERYGKSFPIVAVGIDTLEYTAPLELRGAHVERLQALQDSAKRGEPELITLGGDPRPTDPWVLPGLVFEPLAHGARRYKWGLSNAELGVRLWFTDSAEVPNPFKCELGSHALWHFGPDVAYRHSRKLVCEFLDIGNSWPARPARVDFTVDFQGLRFNEDDPLRAVTRAKRVWDHRDIEAICPECDEPYLDTAARFCGACGAERSRTAKRHERAGAEVVRDLAGAPYYRRERTIETEVSAERCPNPALAPARVSAGVLPTKHHGGRRHRRAFTGWDWGTGNPLKGRLYNKSIEVDTKSPEKIWFYRRWEKTPGYVHADCPACGRVQHKAVIVPADAPRTQWRDEDGELVIEAAAEDPLWIVPERPPRKEKRKKKSGLARLARLLCVGCHFRGKRVVMRERQVWRLEVEARGNLLTRFAPDGENAIETVDDVIEHADTVWFYLVGAPYRQCKRCQSVPVGKAQRLRYCPACVDEWKRAHARLPTGQELRQRVRAWRRRNGTPADRTLRRAQLGRIARRVRLDLAPRLTVEEQRYEWAACKLERNGGWLEARDCSQNPDGDPRYWPVTDWWHYLQALHFSFSGPAVQESRRVRLVANADINQNMMFGCNSSWGSQYADTVYENFQRQHYRPPTARELFDALDRASFGALDPLERLAELSRKRALNGQAPLVLTPSSQENPCATAPSSVGESSATSSPPSPPSPGSPPDAEAPARVYREVHFDVDSSPVKGNQHAPPQGKDVPF